MSGARGAHRKTAVPPRQRHSTSPLFPVHKTHLRLGSALDVVAVDADEDIAQGNLTAHVSRASGHNFADTHLNSDRQEMKGSQRADKKRKRTA